tara:strand:+ start:742 stop:987 length:246 start_codon:yes stop_codon:yes gene_type:complete
MKIKYFAWIKDITNSDEEEIDSEKINNLNDLKEFMKKKYPDLQKYLDKEILRFAVNQEYIITNINLDLNDEIAIFPPVSGG